MSCIWQRVNCMRLSSCILLLMSAAVTVVQAEELLLCSKGKTSYKIVIPQGYSLSEQYAARELTKFLKEIANVEMSTVLDSEPLNNAEIILGCNNSRLEELGVVIDKKTLGDEGYRILTKGKRVIIAGSSVRGTLYGVYGFLEDYLGCRWYAPDCTVIPRKDTIVIGDVDDTQIPGFQYRELWCYMGTVQWGIRNRVNGERLVYESGDDSLKRIGITNIAPSGVHTFFRYVSPQKYFNEHPEYFSEVNGKRLKGPKTQLCLTNPQVVRLVVEGIKKDIQSRPQQKVWDISQMDWGCFCTCNNCSRITEQQGSLSGPLILFANKIAEEIANEYPDIRISTLAYINKYTRKPPRNVKPHKNLIIRLCTYRCVFSTPFGKSGSRFAKDIRGWAAKSDSIYIWDYVTNFWHYLMPHPNLSVLGENIRFFRDNGAIGYMAQGNSQSPGGEFNKLRCWVLSKLMWNPDLDSDLLIREFVDAYYGPAANHILEYITLIHDSCKSSGTRLKTKMHLNASFLNAPTVYKAMAILKKAENDVKEFPVFQRRVRLARLGIDYVVACRYWDMRKAISGMSKKWGGPAQYEDAVQQVRTTLQANRITRYGEGKDVRQLFANLELGRMPARIPSWASHLRADEFIDCQDGGCLPNSALFQWVRDSKASDNVAGRAVGSRYDWGMQYRLEGLTQTQLRSTYDIYVMARCELTGKRGAAFMFGLYDKKARKAILQRVVKAADVSSDGYVTYYMGRTRLKPTMYLWFANPNNGKNVKYVYMDRFFLVKAGRSNPKRISFSATSGFQE